MRSHFTKFQIGKSGINPGIIESLKLAFKNHKEVRVSVLKSTGRDKQKIKQMASEIQEKLGIHVDYRIIGFTIILRKRTKKQGLKA